MYLSIEYKFLFIHIPKCAGEWLYNKLRYGIHTPRIAYWGLDKESDIDLAHLYQDIVTNYMPMTLYNQYFTFAIVRNPYNRFYSAYKDLLKKMSEYEVWYTKYPKYNTFEEFTNIVEKLAFNDTISRHNIHIIPQYRFIIKDGINNVNKLIRFEKMDTDIIKLFTERNIKFIKNKNYKGRNLHFNDINADKIKQNYFHLYTPKILNIVNRLYKKDFELLGYDMLSVNDLKKMHLHNTNVDKLKLSRQKIQKQITLRRESLINIYTIKYIEDCAITELIEESRQIRNFKFDLKLSKKPKIEGFNKNITDLMYKYNQLWQDCIQNNITTQDINKFSSCFMISNLFHKHKTNDPSIIINNISYFWNISNFYYFKKYFKTCQSEIVGLRYIYNNLDITKENILNSMKSGIEKKLDGYNPHTANILYISNDLRIKSNSDIKISSSKKIYKYNLNDTVNLYSLHKLIDKKYHCCHCIENAVGILDLFHRNIIREYVVFQRILRNIIIGYQVLKVKGTLMLSFEGASLEISKQLIYLLSFLFEKVTLETSIIRLNYSNYFYVICEQFTGFDKNIFKNLINSDKKISEVNKTIGERLILENKNDRLKYNLKLPAIDSTNSHLTDLHFVTNFINYTPNKEIDNSIEHIVLHNYKIANNYLENIKSYNIFNSNYTKYIVSSQKLIAMYILNKYFNFNVKLNYKNPINKQFDTINISLIHIPRSGLTGLKFKLWNKCNKNYSISQRNMIFNIKNKYYSILSLYHLRIDDYPPNSTKISIVRNPYDRFLSAFNYIKEGGRNNPAFPDAEKSAQRLFEKYRINSPLDIFTSDKWLKNKILNIELFKPQHIYICRDNTILVDKLLYFHQMESIYKFFNKLLGINMNYKTKLNVTQKGTQLTQNEKEYIYQYYKKDFKIFGFRY